jgi:hypothetical protein
MKKKVENTDQSNKNADDWKQVALVLDRTFFIAYVFWFVISVFVMIPTTISISQTNLSTTNVTSSTNTTYNLTLI